MGALAKVPAVVCPGAALAHLLPTAFADVVDEEAGARGVRVEGEAEGVAQPRGERLLALLADVGAPGEVAAGAVGARIRVGRGDAAVARYAQNLAQEDVQVTGGVVLAETARVVCVVAGAITHRDVEEAVLAEAQIPRIVMMHIGYVVNEYLVRCGGVRVRQHVALHSINRYVSGVLRANAVLLKSIEEIYVVVGDKVWVYGNPE